MTDHFMEFVRSAQSELARKVVQKPEGTGLQYACPCCRYVTLKGRGNYEICALCAWEDDGQDEPYQDEVWKGPNGEFSLTQARENFLRFLVMYPPDEDYRPGGVDTEGERELKRVVLAGASGGNVDEKLLARLVRER